MHKKSALGALAALAHEDRLDMFRLLLDTGPGGSSARRIGERLGLTPAGVSAHLSELVHACLVLPRQAGPTILYTVNTELTTRLLAFLGGEAIPRSATALASLSGDNMDDKVYNVLFLCTGNSARSIMAEAVLNTLGRGRFRAWSAGSQPAGAVHPLALEELAGTAYPLGRLRSKSWEEFSQPGAPHMDFIVTVCDKAAGETCPLWPGHPISAHWSFEDPAAVAGTEDERRAAFHRVYRQILTRMNLFASLPLHMLEKNAIKAELDGIGARTAP